MTYTPAHESRSLTKGRYDDAVAPDGSPVALYRALSGDADAAFIDAAIPPRSQILELGAGAGRVTHGLIQRGHHVVAVDNSPEMLAHVRGAETVLADIETLNLGRRFAVVLLGSYLINTDDDIKRRAFLDACRRHCELTGGVLIERFPADWATTAREASDEYDGVRITLTDVRRAPPFVSAVAVFEVDGMQFRQPYTARVLDDDDVEAALGGAGLTVSRHLTNTWLEARPVLASD